MPFDDELLSRIEDAGLNASAPPQQRWLDGWLLRFSPGKARRLRCIPPQARGEGLATLLCKRLLSLSVNEGVHVAYLQVEGDNHAARRIYQRLGFADAYRYRYHYRAPPPEPA